MASTVRCQIQNAGPSLDSSVEDSDDDAGASSSRLCAPEDPEPNDSADGSVDNRGRRAKL